MGWLFKSKSDKKEKNEINPETSTKKWEPAEMLNKLLSLMDCKATIAQDVDEANNIVLNISTDGAGRIIGEKGETLFSLQYLVNKILYTKNANNPKIIIDIDHYRSKRKDRLIVMAKKTAELVKKSGQASSLPPLNSYERKMIHESLRDDDEVITQSEGEGYYKKVFVFLKNEIRQ